MCCSLFGIYYATVILKTVLSRFFVAERKYAQYIHSNENINKSLSNFSNLVYSLYLTEIVFRSNTDESVLSLLDVPCGLLHRCVINEYHPTMQYITQDSFPRYHI